MLASSMCAARRAPQFEYDTARVMAFMRTLIPGLQVPADAVAMGLIRGGRLAAGVVFEGINSFNCWVHVAVKPGARVTRDALRAVFTYPFIVCGVRRVSGYVDESNSAARRFDEHLGFREETRLKGAAKDGGDVIVYVMWRHECRYLEN